MGQRKEDCRTTYTKKALKDACKELIREHPERKLTVKNLCARVGINRATFYLHYDGVGALLQELVQPLGDQISNLLLENSLQTEKAPEVTGKILKLLETNPEVSELLMGDTPNRVELDVRWDPSQIQAWKELHHVTDEELSWFSDYLMGGCMALMRRWYRDGTLGENETSEFLQRIIYGGLGAF